MILTFPPDVLAAKAVAKATYWIRCQSIRSHLPWTGWLDRELATIADLTKARVGYPYFIVSDEEAKAAKVEYDQLVQDAWARYVPLLIEGDASDQRRNYSMDRLSSLYKRRQFVQVGYEFLSKIR